MLTPEERQLIINWGNEINLDQRAGAEGIGSNDSIAAMGAAKMAWGIASKQPEIFSSGYSAYVSALPYILNNVGDASIESRHSGRMTNLEEYNLNVSHLVDGAAILENAGLNGFELKHDGKSIRDAVIYLASEVVKRPANFSLFALSSNGFHLGWVPIYLNFFKDSAEAVTLQQLMGKLNFFPIEALNLGGPVQCLWGYSAP